MNDLLNEALECVRLAKLLADSVSDQKVEMAGQVVRLSDIRERFENCLKRAEQAASKLDGLTPRAMEVVAAVAEGLQNPQIAERLGVSRETVKAHLRVIFKKTGVSTRSQLVKLVVSSPP